MIIIHAFLSIKPSMRDEFLEQADVLVQKSRAEAGNISYALFEAAEEENAFVVLEKWKDQDAVNEHNGTAHFVGFFQKADAYLAKPPKVELYESSEA
ncbi:putative quinol monooxygenase [Paenibacillus caui]|uniref:putative quinol monooxygenase n=1 Tax=Paenibacillus caui TaxID=2873927 RepID=UPI001CA9E02F|nr:putative quinol monooxygenase [Paenibacillus caui]